MGGNLLVRSHHSATIHQPSHRVPPGWGYDGIPSLLVDSAAPRVNLVNPDNYQKNPSSIPNYPIIIFYPCSLDFNVIGCIYQNTHLS